ncbi:MAG: hypothetical protein ACOX8V_03930 [Thermoleophilia bacterium]
MRTSTSVRAATPVTRGAFWLMISLLAWEIYQGIRADAPVRPDSWAAQPVDLVFLALLPALTAFAFARLFLVITQSVRGTIDVYSAISSPFAWVFWLGLAVGLIGHGVHLAGHALHKALPAVYIQGEFAAKIAFLDTRAGYLLFGLGFFVATAVILFLGHGGGQRIAGPIRAFFIFGSLATYGAVFVYLGVAGGLLIPAITGSVVLSAIGLWALPPYEITRDPVAALIVPGSFLAGLTLIVWTLIVGGQPTWP